jgi:hypothetical protein
MTRFSSVTTKNRYSNTTIQEPEPETVHNLCDLKHFAQHEKNTIIIYRDGGQNSMIV